MSVIGIDEVGRGCWAGPLVAGAVCFAEGIAIKGVKDSKLLSAKKRTELARLIKEQALDIGIGWVWPEEINQLGLTESVRLAMNRAVEELSPDQAEEIIIDGNIDYLQLSNSKAVIKADGSVPAVAAASIIAKVARDTYMVEISKEYPKYSFEKHVGYGTKLHQEALRLYGVLPIHRLNYRPIQKLVGSS